ncbi:MAG TPA: phage holin family protein [Burkholderiales bacterium]|nr:phage holin family protein [Burkholderiales bacterium]
MPRRSLVGLVSDLWRDSAQLIRGEFELAKTEISEKISRARSSIVSIAAGAALALIGLAFVLDAVVQLLAIVLPEEQAPWLSPLIVGGFVALAGFGLAFIGVRQFAADPQALPHVRRSVQEDAQLVKDHMS